jgi:DNA-binding GntR family transcriptional regulator
MRATTRNVNPGGHAVLDLASLGNKDDLQPLDRSSLSRRATDLLRHAIVEGILKPGEYISIRDLAQRVKVSQTPIREALIHLSAIGLVEFHPGHVQIAAATAPALRDAFELREALGGMAARFAAMRRTSAEADLIKDLAHQSHVAANAGQQDEFRRLDSLFHRSIGKAARSAQVERYMSNALDLALTLRNLRSFGRDFKAASSHVHSIIADAIDRRAPDEAEAASREHVRAVCEASIKNHNIESENAG